MFHLRYETCFETVTKMTDVTRNRKAAPNNECGLFLFTVTASLTSKPSDHIVLKHYPLPDKDASIS